MSALSTPSRTAQTAQAAQATPPVVLDPCTLGRPYHLLNDVLHDIERKINHALHERFNLRRGAHFVATQATITALLPRDAAGWHAYASEHGQIAVRIGRQLLLALLACHYDTPLDAATLAAPGPETGTERRFATQLHGALLGTLASAIAPAAATAEPTFTAAADPHANPGARIVRIAIEDRKRDLTGELEFALDDAWLAHLFARLDAKRPRQAAWQPDGTPAKARIPVTLSVRMLTKDLRLDDLLRMSAGDVLPVRLPDTADVLAGDVRLYRAALAEQQGALWITAFEPVE